MLLARGISFHLILCLTHRKAALSGVWTSCRSAFTLVENVEQFMCLSSASARKRWCVCAGAEEGPHDPVTVHEVEVGVRCCFYWLSDDAERTLSPAERIKWMEESGKGECQDAAVTQTDFAGSSGSVFAGESCLHQHSRAHCCAIHARSHASRQLQSCEGVRSGLTPSASAYWTLFFCARLCLGKGVNGCARTWLLNLWRAMTPSEVVVGQGSSTDMASGGGKRRCLPGGR